MRIGFLVILFVTIATGCGTVQQLATDDANLAQHILTVNERGRVTPISAPGGVAYPRNARGLDLPHTQRYVHHMMDAIRSNTSPNDTIMVVLHGGLVSSDHALKNAAWQHDEIMDAGYYPLFINWHSTLATTYWEHVVWVRQGERRWWAPFFAPFQFVADLSRGVARAPITMSQQLAAEYRSRPSHVSAEDASYQQLRAAYNDSQQIRAYRGDYRATRRIRLSGLYRWPLRLVRMLGSPIVDGFGTPSWNNMLRRTDLVFRTEADFEGDLLPAEHGHSGTGAISVLLDSLSVVMNANEKRPLIIVSHSLGGLIVDKMIAKYPDLPISDIVYLAPANSIVSFVTHVVPYLKANPSTRVYIVTLHPKAEIRESPHFPLLPGGSLLEWIDGIHSNASTPYGRTLGRWENVIRASHTFPTDVRGQIYLRAYGYRDDETTYGRSRRKPIRHGHFNDRGVPFWDRTFWSPVSPANAE